MRTKISKKSEYYITKERRMELAHFCKQYPDWINERIWLIYDPQKTRPNLSGVHSGTDCDATSKTATQLAYLNRNIRFVEQAAKETDPIIGDFIFQAAIRGISYDKVNAYNKIPCCRNEFYRLYRKFFWLLDQKIRHDFVEIA